MEPARRMVNPASVVSGALQLGGLGLGHPDVTADSHRDPRRTRVLGGDLARAMETLQPADLAVLSAESISCPALFLTSWKRLKSAVLALRYSAAEA